MAMVARGYTGNVRTLQRSRPGRADAIWVVACLAIAVVVLRLDRVVA
jgi:energy-coupling factor transporter transmembrane protein EcfT